MKDYNLEAKEASGCEFFFPRGHHLKVVTCFKNFLSFKNYHCFIVIHLNDL